MSVWLSAVIPGDPRGKGSVRVYGGRAVKDAKTAEYMTRAILVLQAANAGRPPITGPWRCEISAYCGRPARLIPNPRGRKEQPSSAAFPATCKPDADNIAKAVLDAVVQAGVVCDDCSCVELRVRKLYVAMGEAARVEIEVVDGWIDAAGPALYGLGR